MEMELANKVRARREELGWSQDELAKRMGYKSRTSINKIETGRPVTQKIIARLASALNVSVSYLMGWDKPLEVSEERQQKNDAAVDIVLRLNADEEFYSLVELLHKLDAEQLAGIKAMLSGFVK